ncbi:MAG: RCC1 domain-containing protein [Longimicrobiaceae bacterium]
MSRLESAPLSPRPRRSAFALSLLLAATPILAAPVWAQAPAWKSVSVGFDHACALDTAGRAYCWGYNHSGHLGARTSVKCGIISESGARGCYPVASEGVPVLAADGMRFASISAGEYVTCGIDPEARAFCWGDPMGDTASYRDRCLREVPCSFSPVPLDPGRRYVALDARSRCFAAADGSARCWGTAYRHTGDVSTPWSVPVVAVAGDPEGETFCALGRDGRAYCEGEADFGVPGRRAASGPAEGGARFTGLAALYHWVCGLDARGAAHCWGAASYSDAQAGQARDGFEQCAKYGTRTWCNRTPAPVAGAAGLRSVTAMPRGTMPGVYEMVGLTADGRAYVWGGDRVARPWHPERRWASVAAGRWGQCGVTTGGELYCWGLDPHEEVQGRIPHPR